ncbi:MAG: DUF1501 domain-containing protein [Acidobacteria bacterium]|nr:DUF1501 domain-containing protein [Acidobacteriota bacterium]
MNNKKIGHSRRHFLKAAAVPLAATTGLTKFGLVNALAQQGVTDYRALVCIFLVGGNDGHNTVIPRTSSEYNLYKTIRGSLALPDSNGPVLDVTALNGTPYGLNNGLQSIHSLWAAQKLAVVGNVGMLVQPTTRAQFLGSAVPLPSNLFSHSDQIIQMQTGTPTGSGGTGWAGRVADQMQPANGSSTFPASLSMSGQSIFCAGNVVQSASLIPGFDSALYGLNIWPASAGAARATAMQEIFTMNSGLSVIQAANQVRQDAAALSAMLKSAGSSQPLTTQFPGGTLGDQLKQVTQIIQLRNQTGIKRQVFFCSLGGFDTHSSQSWQQWDLLKQVSQAMLAFYNATVELGLADKVTTFTESEFGRSLQPSGVGSDHGWGNHHLVLGGAVKGGDLYGAIPPMALGGPNDSGTRGVLIPSVSLDQYGATMAKWFGLNDAAIDLVFPNLKFFPTRDIGFLG